jgi:ketopantoate reductase
MREMNRQLKNSLNNVSMHSAGQTGRQLELNSCYKIRTFAALVSSILGDTVRSRMINMDEILGAVFGLGRSSWRSNMSVQVDS